jgi:hypothetical protein
MAQQTRRVGHKHTPEDKRAAFKQTMGIISKAYTKQAGPSKGARSWKLDPGSRIQHPCVVSPDAFFRS